MELRALIKNIRPDVVHAQWGSTTALIGLLATGNKGVPLVISFCGGDLDEVDWGYVIERLRSKLAVIMSRFCARYAEVIIVKSANLYALLPKAVKAKTYILPNGVDTAKFRSMPKVKARGLLSWDPCPSVILFCGSANLSNDVYKNPALAQAAFSFLKTERNDVVLEIIRDVAHEMMPVYYNAADVLLVTSLKEGSPNIVKEAMACNLPIVTVNCGDVLERLKNVYPGHIVDSYDPSLIANAILDILQSKSRSNGWEELRRQGLEIERIAEKLVKVYHMAVTKNSQS